MKKYKAVILNKSEKMVNYVFSEEQIREIGKMTELRSGVASADDVDQGLLQDTEVVFTTWQMPPLTEEQLAKMPNLKAVFYAAGATDYFARPCFARNIKVFSAWQANAIPVAEFCLGQILLGLKGYFRTSRLFTKPDAVSQSDAGPGVYGATVALIGAGAISSKLQELLRSFKVNVIVIPSRKEKRTISLEEAFAKAQVVSNHLPDRDDNVGVLDGKLFRSMRPGAVFINTGRGRQVNEAELIEVLEERSDLTALLDVTHPEPPEAGSKLYTLPNVLLSPHIAGSLNDEVHRMSDYMIEEYRRFASGEPCLYEVHESMLLTSRN